jgi:hypothetical protein
MQEASLLNTTIQACGLFNEAEVSYLWTSIVPRFMVEISYLSIYNDNFFLFCAWWTKMLHRYYALIFDFVKSTAFSNNVSSS